MTVGKIHEFQNENDKSKNKKSNSSLSVCTFLHNHRKIQHHSHISAVSVQTIVLWTVLASVSCVDSQLSSQHSSQLQLNSVQLFPVQLVQFSSVGRCCSWRVEVLIVNFGISARFFLLFCLAPGIWYLL